MDEHTSHELAYQKGYDKGYEDAWCDGFTKGYSGGYEVGLNANKWIPVTERLPEINAEVLCYRGNHIGALMDAYTYMGDYKWQDTYGFWNYTEDEGITHWMHLPEPPKGE